MGELYMSEHKKDISKLCLAGFILAILPVILIKVRLPFQSRLLDLIMIAAVIISPLVGFILSIAGLVSAKKNGRKGKGFGIAGIVLPSIYAVIIGILALFGYLMVWTLSPHETDKKLTTFYSDSEVIAVRYYCIDQDGYRFEELDEERLDEFISDLDSMEIKTGGMVNMIHSYGIEMELDDGTYLDYDGKRLYLISGPIDSENLEHIENEAVQVTDQDFWEVMKDYFPSIEANGDHVG